MIFKFMILIYSLDKTTPEERYLLMYMLAVLIIISALIIVFFVVFTKRKNKLILEKLQQQKVFQEEISKTQLEIQEQTLKDIGRELHDNVGQLLSVASMQMSMLAMQIHDDTLKTPFSETKNIIKDSLSEIRALSKSLNSDVILRKGFKQSVNNEVVRLNKLKGIQAELVIEGHPEFYTESKNSIILFRILQEFISNTVKYAEASMLSITLSFNEDNLFIKAKDNGKGFDVNAVVHGSGLLNMTNRAKLINANLNISSKIGEGVLLTVDYPYQNEEAIL